MNAKPQLTALLLLFLLASAASAGPFRWLFGRHGGNKASADGCLVTMEKIKVKQQCFDVECKQICIPHVQFPWPWVAHNGKGKIDCDSRCGKVRTVRVLTKKEYESTECKCVWTPAGKKDVHTSRSNAASGEMNRIPAPPPPAPIPAPTARRYFDDSY